MTSSIRRMAVRAALAATLVATVAAFPVTAQDHAHPPGDVSQIGRVTFPVSCTDAVRPRFEQAVAMMHSFWFASANAAFNEILRDDPQCAMAHWGIAITMMGNPMTRAAPSEASSRAGVAAVARAKELAGTATHREQMYIAAAAAYYDDISTRDHLSRMKSLEDAFAALHTAHPEDMEAAIFHGRTMVANASPTDLTFAMQLHAAEMLQPLFEQHPEHPGLAHYIIHAFDAPQLAERGTKAAFAYAGIAPAAPHALHMPSHIFTRLGYWDESIETNARSARAEPDSNAAVHPNDYLVYAYLQQGRDSDARRVVERSAQAADAFYGGLLGYNFVAMPARFVLERGAWSEAAALKVPANAEPYVKAITHFARAIGAARNGNPGAAQVEVDALAQLEAALDRANNPYWATVVKAQRLAAGAWIAHASGDDAGAVRMAAEAADLEDTFEKHPVTPGPLLPARELEGDLLLELGRPADAFAAYELTLKREPRRARALFGAARAAELAGDGETARARYRELAEVMAKGERDLVPKSTYGLPGY